MICTKDEPAGPPKSPSQCAAAVSLSEQGADHPYVTIFYSVVRGTIYFWGLPVAGTEEREEEKVLVYDQRENDDEANTTDPDEIEEPLIEGQLTATGLMILNDDGVVLRSESEALTFISVIRALYQMRGELDNQGTES